MTPCPQAPGLGHGHGALGRPATADARETNKGSFIQACSGIRRLYPELTGLYYPLPEPSALYALCLRPPLLPE